MHCLRTLCRLQLHKIASEQMHGDAALMEFLHSAHDQDGRTRQGNRRTTGMPAQHQPSREPTLPVRNTSKENDPCTSQ